jgi:acetyltransferase-like isoleucine patch superfamily enzyme
VVREDCIIGEGTKIWHPELVNLYGCLIGKDCNIGAFVEIGENVIIGDRCRIAAFSFLCDGVILEDDVFVGPRVTFTNDKYPPSDTWGRILVKHHAAIGAGSIILPNVTIHPYALVGAGCIVTKDVFGKAIGIAARNV